MVSLGSDFLAPVLLCSLTLPVGSVVAAAGTAATGTIEATASLLEVEMLLFKLFCMASTAFFTRSPEVEICLLPGSTSEAAAVAAAAAAAVALLFEVDMSSSNFLYTMLMIQDE